jgi:hypothetical protein
VPGKVLLLLGWMAAAAAASPCFDPSWSHLSAGTEISELRTPASRTYSNGDGTFTVDIAPARLGGTDSQEPCEPTSTGSVYYWYDGLHGVYGYAREGPALHYLAATLGSAAYAKFDLSPIPDSSIVILSAQFLCYQYVVNSTPVRTRCTHPWLDPDSASNEDAYSLIRNGQVLAETSFSDTGWMGYDLGSQGITLLHGLLQQDRVTLGIKPVAGEASSYGSNEEDRHTSLHIVYGDAGEAEIRALNADLPTYPMVANGSDTAQLAMTNKGLHASGQFWSYASAPGLGAESTLVGSIAAGQTVSVALPLPTCTTSNALVTYRLWSTCPIDAWRANDTTQLACWVFPQNTYYAEGFDKWFPTFNWAIVDNDGGSERWKRSTNDSLVHSGAGFAMCAREQTAPNDDWLISGPVYPKTDEPDSLGFFCRLYQAGSPLYLQTWAMRGQSVSDTIRRLMTEWVSDTAYRRRLASLDSLDGDRIYIGFRCQSSASWNGLCLDDVWFSGNVPKPPREAVQRTTAKLPDFALAPNPSGRRVVTVRSTLAVGKRRTVTMRDVVGRAVRTFMIDQSGIARLDLRGMPAGVYMATLEAGTQSLTRKLVITAR